MLWNVINDQGNIHRRLYSSQKTPNALTFEKQNMYRQVGTLDKHFHG